MSNVLTKLTDGTHHSPPNLTRGEYKYISAKNIKPWGIDLTEITYVTNEIHREIYARCNPEFGDVLYIKDGATTGVVTINTLKEPFSMLSSVALMKPSVGLFNRYLVHFLASPSFYAEVRSGMTGVAITRVTLSRLGATPFALPPLAEQHRIVAKVDELMALCDRLEAEQADAEAAHAHLVDALLAALTRGTDAADFAANWQRLAAHFDTLFTTEAAIDALKQIVLELAVMGKLAPQDPNDEPAIELLHWITVERSELEAAGKIRKSKPLQAIEDAAQPFPLPPNWAWARLGEVTLESGAGWSPNCESRRRENDEWGVLKVSAVSWGIFNPDENKALPSNLQPRPDCEVVQGDFLVSRANTAELVARSVWVESCPQRLMLSDKIVRLKLSQHMNGQFVNLANTCAHARSYYAAVAGGTSSSMKNVSREQILNLAIPLPPIAEQHRIVARVNELMALCDRLKADLAIARQHQATLADTLIAVTLEAV